ncbi:hypothetical protein C8R47DRAFT_1317246 [Mycena vitilis]|nr:hypothetical protein C8R47DRAFT_1317246 [Mycena vitilis]
MTTESPPSRILLVGTQIHIHHSVSTSAEPIGTYDLSTFKDRLHGFYTPRTERVQGDLSVQIPAGGEAKERYKDASYTIEPRLIEFRIEGFGWPDLVARISFTKAGYRELSICWNEEIEGQRPKPIELYCCHFSDIWTSDGRMIRFNRPDGRVTRDEEVCGQDLRNLLDHEMAQTHRLFGMERNYCGEQWANQTYQLIFLGISALKLLDLLKQ